MAGSKGNNTAARDKTPSFKTINGQMVKPVLYAGSGVGHGKYMAGVLGNDMIRDANGKPIPYASIISDSKKPVLA